MATGSSWLSIRDDHDECFLAGRDSTRYSQPNNTFVERDGRFDRRWTILANARSIPWRLLCHEQRCEKWLTTAFNFLIPFGIPASRRRDAHGKLEGLRRGVVERAARRATAEEAWIFMPEVMGTLVRCISCWGKILLCIKPIRPNNVYAEIVSRYESVIRKMIWVRMEGESNVHLNRYNENVLEVLFRINNIVFLAWNHFFSSCFILNIRQE